MHLLSPKTTFKGSLSQWSLRTKADMASPQNAVPGIFSWGRYRIPPDDPLQIQVGPLAVFVKKEGDEIWVAHHGIETEGAIPKVSDPGLRWERWGASESLDEIEILPTFPDRPLVLHPENPFHLLPGAKARIYVRAPLWIRLQVPGRLGGELAEIPTLPLSDTWWGGPEDGELAYWLHIRARREAPQEIFLPDRIICPLALVNRAEEDLPVEKILLRARHLSVFKGPGSLWSDEIRIRYRGEEEGSELEMMGKAPPEAPGAPRLTPPRTPLAKGFTARTFARLKALPGFGKSF